MVPVTGLPTLYFDISCYNDDLYNNIYMHIHVDNDLTLQDVPIHITADGLNPYATYHLHLRLPHLMGTFLSEATFRADGSGVIDLKKDEPIRGDYTGVRPMGLFETLQPGKDFRPGGYAKCTPPPVWKFQITLKDAVMRTVDTYELTKLWQHPSVERTDIEEGRIRGTIYKPSGPGPFPSIVDFSGTGGGLQEHKSVCLANEGFCVLALAYFSYKDLPQELNDVEVEYFLEAINWFTSLSYTSDRIGIEGVSFGGALVALLATRSDKIKAVVSINGPHAISEVATLKEHGAPMKAAQLGQIGELSEMKQNGLVREDKLIRGLVVDDDCEFHLENAAPDVAFRFVVALDDLSTPTVYAANRLTSVLRKSGHKFEVDMVPGGHLMEPPYFSHHAHVYSKFVGVSTIYGGEVSQHGKSQPEVWKRTVNFFKRELGTPPHIPKLVPLSHL